ncbi:MAG: GNAT family N-acetyltransferase [Myxococcota bacterium]|nr:GNAT family N-acetyltransferase [Myxococcota bacterium]
MEIPELETDRLLLRPVTRADAPDIQRHFGRWEIIQYLSVKVPWPYPEDGAVTFLRDRCLPGMARGEAMVWGIRLKKRPEEVVGILDYRSADEGLGNRGFWIGEEFQGYGYMSEAVTALQDLIFFDLKVERIVVLNAVNNPASRRVKEKTGARLIDTVEMEHHNGESQCERWEVTRESWAAVRGRPLD